MRITFLPAILIAVFSSCNTTTNTTSQEKMPMAASDIAGENLKGKIKQVETDTYLIDSTTGKMGKLESKSVEVYDDSGYDVSYTNYTTKDSATTVTSYKRKPNGYMTDMATTKNGKPLSSMKIESDSAGKYTAATSFDSTGKMDMFFTDIKSNDFGQVLSGTSHHPDSTLKFTFTNNYDSIYYTGGESKDSVGKTTYSGNVTLNDKKDVEKMEETNVTKDSTKKTTTTYAYDTWDNTGNWTQQTVTENGKPKKIVKRMITYQP